MTLDDVYGADNDRFPLEQDAADWDESTLDWDDEEALLANEMARQLED